MPVHLALIDEAIILASTLPATALCLDVPTVEIECVRGVVVTMVLGGVFGCACDSIEIRFKSSVQLARISFIKRSEGAHIGVLTSSLEES